jgi:DNA-directed RNA polymerase specialized sigma24 family protein
VAVSIFGDRAYRLAIGVTGNHQDAEEPVQDAFWNVIRKIDTFRGDASLGSWIYRITANAAYQKRPRRLLQRLVRRLRLGATAAAPPPGTTPPLRGGTSAG